jgi:hypothetical protein
MADHGRTEYATAAGNDLPEHEATYANVMKLTKVGTVAVLCVVVALGIWGTVGSIFWTAFGVLFAIVTLVIGMVRDSAVPPAGLLVLLLLAWALMV